MNQTAPDARPSTVALALSDGVAHVRRVGFGTMGASGSYGPVEPSERDAALRAALELGACFIDTADVYGDIEPTLATVRRAGEDAVIATKVGLRRNPDARFGVDIDGTPEYLRAAVLTSLERLGTDTLDLVYLHRIADAVPVEESIGALGELVDEGLVRGIGLSEARVESIERAQAVHRLTSVQSEYSLWSRDVEESGVLDACRRLGIAFVASSPLGKGFFAAELAWPPPPGVKDSRLKLPRFADGAFSRNRELLAPLTSVATAHGASLPQVALAWLLAQPGVDVAIPSSRRASRVRENARASEVTLSPTELELLDAAFAPSRVEGQRYADMGFVNR